MQIPADFPGRSWAYEERKTAGECDSLSTQYNKNAVEIEVTSADVGVNLSAYATLYDVGTVIGGHAISQEDVGNEITFTPTGEDVGKRVGVPLNYNTSVSKVWWQYLEEAFACEVNPVCWSGSSMSSHEAALDKYRASWGWHESQIRKLGRRIPGSMEREAPDLVILYRGCNDMTHAPYAVLTKGYFDDPDWNYPETDVVQAQEVQAGYQEAMALTIGKIRSTYPDARIVICTQNNFRRVNCDAFPTRNGLYNLPQVNRAVRECADFFGCPVISFDKDGITWENCYVEGYITDSPTIPTHPNDKGHQAMARQAIADLKELLG